MESKLLEAFKRLLALNEARQEQLKKEARILEADTQNLRSIIQNYIDEDNKDEQD